MKRANIHYYENVDYTIPISNDMYEKVEADVARVRMFGQDNAFALLNQEIDRLHFRFKTFGRKELEEEIVARTIALKEYVNG